MHLYLLLSVYLWLIFIYHLVSYIILRIYSVCSMFHLSFTQPPGVIWYLLYPWLQLFPLHQYQNIIMLSFYTHYSFIQTSILMSHANDITIFKIVIAAILFSGEYGREAVH
jgi:hypothetical protein